MSHYAARLSLVVALSLLVSLPDTASAGIFRRRCRNRNRCETSTCQTYAKEMTAVSGGCQSGSICVTRLTAKYMDSTGKCIYAVYDAVQCPSATISHYDSNCAYVCPKSCTTSPCSCITRTAVQSISSERDDRQKGYTATKELLEKGLTAAVEGEEYPNGKKVDEYVIELDKNTRVRIIWIKLAEGRYAGAGHQVDNSTPVSPVEIRHTESKIMVDGKPSRSFLVQVSSINGVKVDQDYVVLVK